MLIRPYNVASYQQNLLWDNIENVEYVVSHIISHVEATHIVSQHCTHKSTLVDILRTEIARPDMTRPESLTYKTAKNCVAYV